MRVTKAIHKILTISVFLAGLLNSAWAFEEFVVNDVKVQGLKVLTPKHVLKDLTLRLGEPFDQEAARNTIKQLYDTGQFDLVQLAKEGQVLIIQVKERPIISKISIDGNEDIKTEDLITALKGVGLSEGEVYNQAVLERIERELQQQYFAVGKYNVKIKSEVENIGENRVAVKLSLNEGDAARIKAINIVGNQVVSDKELLDLFQSKDSDWLDFLTKSTQYSKQRLSGDLESLRSYYMDRGYAGFQIESTQVTITPNKQNIYITVNIKEGEKHSVNMIDVAGDMVVPREKLLELVNERVVVGDTFSRKEITSAQNAISSHLGEEGYILANVNVAPDINEETNEVGLTFFVNPGQRMYVRRINFRGNTQTKDVVLRQEMRQMEQAWANSKQIQRSRTRLERLGFFSKVDVDTPKVPGTSDQVDVNYAVEEQPSGQVSVGVGFSQGDGLILNGGVSHRNFLGSGKFVSANINTSDSQKLYNFAYNDPYFTQDGIGLGYRLFFRERDTDDSNADITDYSIDTLGGGVNFSVPLSENDRVRFGADYKQLKLKTGSQAAAQVSDFVLSENEDFDVRDVLTGCVTSCRSVLASAVDDTSKYDTFVASMSYAHDTRNRGVFASEGNLQSVGLDLVVPGSDLEYGKAFYRGEWYVPFQKKRGFFKDWVMRMRTELAYGFSYGSSDNLPFFENFFAGGINSVRGFDDNSIGPRELLVSDSGVIGAIGDPIGGNLRILGGMDLIFPTPFMKDNPALRTNFFIDAGNLVDTEFDKDDYDGVSAVDIPDYNNLSDFRASVGVGLNWLSAFGALSFSVATPLRDFEGDDTQVFQFSIGSQF